MISYFGNVIQLNSLLRVLQDSALQKYKKVSSRSVHLIKIFIRNHASYQKGGMTSVYGYIVSLSKKIQL